MTATARWTPPPGWPPPPADGWSPPDGWRPDPAWPPAPLSWSFWQTGPAPKETRSIICRVAAADTLVVAGALVLSLVCTLAYDIAHGLGQLYAAFLLGSVPLGLVITFDVLMWRHWLRGRAPSPVLGGTGGVIGLAAAGLPLIMVGAVLTIVQFGFSDRRSRLESWTLTAVGDVLIAAFGAQTVLLVLTWLMRKKSLATPAVRETAGLAEPR